MITPCNTSNKAPCPSCYMHRQCYNDDGTPIDTAMDANKPIILADYMRQLRDGDWNRQLMTLALHLESLDR